MALRKRNFVGQLENIYLLYPHTVAPGYLEYQFYDSLQGLSSYLRGVVSTTAVLSAAGVGDAAATAMSAAMTWAIRDGLGMVGGLLFSYVASSHFDAHVKEFRLVADVLNDVGLTLDMALPVVLSWTRATKGNITDHFSISGNRADVSAKESTQETLVSLIGMALGVWLSNLDSHSRVGELRRSATIASTNIEPSTCTNSIAVVHRDFPSEVSEPLWKSIISMFNNGNVHLGMRSDDVYVMMRMGASESDELRAFLTAHVLQWCIERDDFPSDTMERQKHRRENLVARSNTIVQHLVTTKKNNIKTDIDLHRTLYEHGWDMARLYLGFSPWRLPQLLSNTGSAKLLMKQKQSITT
ncbi:predicted protein [Thalassiosira pseudonana CCMP1335]|uniref:Uncharacterized protein n=1 Tax=Thalassiosira pseudonana TaxID=35128 RepID=B8CDA3_THAPS|nr:predicted protein [Thalassiosira pseudonana CCMP1335]EED88432.1 predicted protein [Thalassiosira pseudonana CCMP1335]